MFKSVPVSLAIWRSLPKTPLVVIFLVVALISFLRSFFRMVIFCVMSGIVGDSFRNCGHVLRPPTGGSTSSKMTSDVAWPSTIPCFRI